MDKKDWEAGYDWVVETIKLDHEYLASKMEVEKALHYLKTKEFDKVPVFNYLMPCQLRVKIHRTWSIPVINIEHRKRPKPDSFRGRG